MTEILLQNNRLKYQGHCLQFSTKYALLFFKLLFEHKSYVSLSQLQQAISAVQNDYILHRTQVIRMLNEIEKVLSNLGIAYRLEYPDRKKTVGPWRLLLDKQVQLVDYDPFLVKQNVLYCTEDRISRYFSNANKLTPRAYTQQFCHFLMSYFNAVSLSNEGFEQEAITIIERCQRFSTSFMLQAFIQVFKARLYTFIGEYCRAREIIEAIQKHPEFTPDSILGSYIQIFSMQIAYNEDPYQTYSNILHPHFLPEKLYQEEPISLINWHNLKALSLRRYILENPEADSEALHWQAILHFEEAIFSSLWVENHIKCLDIIVNYAFHLQKMLPLGLTKVDDVLAWYQLEIAYIDKYDVGNYSVWDRIFFAEFYWENLTEISKCQDKLMDFTGGNPWEEKFYLDSMERVMCCGNKRQYFILSLWYFTFALHHLSFERQKEIANQLYCELIKYPQLFTSLKNGYSQIIHKMMKLVDSF